MQMKLGGKEAERFVYPELDGTNEISELDLINLEFLCSPWEERERSKNRWSPRHGRTCHLEMLVGLDLLFKFLMSIQWVSPNKPFAQFHPSCPK